MKQLPLYEAPPALAVDTIEPRDIDPNCDRCALGARAKYRRCIPPEGEPGGLLLVGEWPTLAEDARGRPFVGDTGLDVRKLVKQFWAGPVVLDLSLRCFVGRDMPKNLKPIDACRPYLAATVREAQPTRIVALGNYGAYAVLGRAASPFNMRRSYAWRPTPGGAPVPVMMVMAHNQNRRNAFIARWFKQDLEWALTTTPPLPPWDAYVSVIETLEDATDALAYLRARGTPVAFDVETAGLLYDPSFRIVALSLCARGDDDSFLFSSEAIANPAIRGALVAYLADPGAPKFGQNIKFDTNAVFSAWGVAPRGIVADVRLWRKLLEPESGAKLSEMANLVGMGGMKDENKAAIETAVKAVRQVIQTEKKIEKYDASLTERLAPGTKRIATKRPVEPPPLSDYGVDAALEPVVRDPSRESEAWVYGVLDRVAQPTLHRYNARDSVATARLGDLLEAELDAHPEAQRIWDAIVQPASLAIAQVEAWGVAADRDALHTFDSYLEMRENEALRTLDGFAKDINWASPDQVAELLFDRMKIRPPKLTESGKRSTDEEVLSLLKDKHPVCAAILDSRSISKLRGTYARGMIGHVRPDGRIHPSILLDGAGTGRTSCVDPNLQNIPRPDSVEGKMARDVFIATDPDHVLLSFDYSQLELRIAAMLSGDEVMADIFRSGVDYHLRTAQLVSKLAWGIEPEQVEKKHRSLAKAFNFGVLYGKTDRTLAKDLGCTIEEAASLRSAIMGKFRKLDEWCRAMLKHARIHGEIWTEWDGRRARRRPLWRIGQQGDDASGARITAENGAVNTPVQGTASDFCIASLAAVTEWILAERVRAKLVLPVHDALLIDTHKSEVARVKAKVQAIMEGWPSKGVPLATDVEEGPAWGSLKKAA